MTRGPFRARTIAMTAAALLAAVGATTARGQDDTRKADGPPTLRVQGHAQLRKPADQVRMSIGVVTQAEDAGKALADNTVKMNAVVAAVREAGLEEREYQTGRFQIVPRQAPRPRPVPPDWRPKIIGYEVTNTIGVRTTKLDLAGTIIEKANRAGANTVQVTGFDLANPRRHRGEAIVQATNHAIEDARRLAEAASLDLVRILSITLDRPASPRPEMAMARAMADSGAAPPIQPGNVLVESRVDIVYEIAPKE
jgi:uncharacterized protein YggE